MSRRTQGAYPQQELDVMVRNQILINDAQDRSEAERTPIAYMLRQRAEEAFRRVPFGEGRLVLAELSSIRMNMTAFIDKGTDISAETAQDVVQAIRACEDQIKGERNGQ